MWSVRCGARRWPSTMSVMAASMPVRPSVASASCVAAPRRGLFQELFGSGREKKTETAERAHPAPAAAAEADKGAGADATASSAVVRAAAELEDGVGEVDVEAQRAADVGLADGLMAPIDQFLGGRPASLWKPELRIPVASLVEERAAQLGDARVRLNPK